MRLLKIALVLIALVFTSIFWCNYTISSNSKNKTFYKVSEIPSSKTGLLLGTSKFLANGYINPYYTYRINAAADLMQAKKIKFLIISGDNSQKNYNEPEMMKQDLVVLGIDSTKLYLDFAGFRTFDSVIRAKEIFGQDSLTIISQAWHNERDIFIAEKEGLKAIGYNAKDVNQKQGLKTQIREKLARVKVYFDYLFNTKPKFLGEKIEIPD
ncbi:vancomycin high temperature exclusion protein [Lacihabitans sp. LS3-19]|uniref:SanA/YdcF family protein n=1 Tax=Lacihabitans sp. LS3-19 TaxID=2487335 RepID=UPI0020CE3550|nr:ElyC/SanA/YdcF family protein [Lacihabitans sp. LS3-19]MCP9768780.1 vancomycin high temperature exclusion protein [Lacihabitans sp. LS3-19]